MGMEAALDLAALTADELAALRLSAQVMAHRAALAGMPRVAMFFERLEAEADAETAARGQRGARSDGTPDLWRSMNLADADRAAIVEHLRLLAENAALPGGVTSYAERLIAAGRVS
jgi:hypothetical protein